MKTQTVQGFFNEPFDLSRVAWHEQGFDLILVSNTIQIAILSRANV